MTIDWRATRFEQAANDGLAASPWERISSKQTCAILDGLDAAGLLLTPERLDEIARSIEANRQHVDGDPQMLAVLDAAAAVVRAAGA